MEPFQNHPILWPPYPLFPINYLPLSPLIPPYTNYNNLPKYINIDSNLSEKQKDKKFKNKFIAKEQYEDKILENQDKIKLNNETLINLNNQHKSINEINDSSNYNFNIGIESKNKNSQNKNIITNYFNGNIIENDYKNDIKAKTISTLKQNKLNFINSKRYKNTLNSNNDFNNKEIVHILDKNIDSKLKKMENILEIETNSNTSSEKEDNHEFDEVDDNLGSKELNQLP